MKYIIITLCDFSVFYFILQILHFALKIVHIFTICSCSHTPSLEHVQNGPRKSGGGSVDNGISGDKPGNQKRMIFQAVGPCLQCLKLPVALRGVMKQITKQALSLHHCDAGQPSACKALYCGRERERERERVARPHRHAAEYIPRIFYFFGIAAAFCRRSAAFFINQLQIKGEV